jgi:hypothetical protein
MGEGGNVSSRKKTETKTTKASRGRTSESKSETRATYERPRVTKKKSMARTTLFSGGGVAAAGLTASG